MALDFDFNNMSESSKAMANGVPFLASIIKDLPTPFYTRLLQAVITFMVIGLIGWSASVVMMNKANSDKILSQLTLLNQQLVYMNNAIAENKAEIKILREATKDRIYRQEWERKAKEQDDRLLHLERYVK